MKRLFITLAALVLTTGVASANPNYWRAYGLLLEVSADPRDGTDHVRVDPTHARSLELVAQKDVVRLRGLTLHFADGRSLSLATRNIYPGQPQLVELPGRHAAITSVELDYGRQLVDRTPARLQIIPKLTRDDGYDRYSRHGRRDRYRGWRS